MERLPVGHSGSARHQFQLWNRKQYFIREAVASSAQFTARCTLTETPAPALGAVSTFHKRVEASALGNSTCGIETIFCVDNGLDG